MTLVPIKLPIKFFVSIWYYGTKFNHRHVRVAGRNSAKRGFFMPHSTKNLDEVKRKLRKLKKLEIKIRTGYAYDDGESEGKPLKLNLVWDEFFNISGSSSSKGKYCLEAIASMGKDEFKNIISEFFFSVYYRYYTENRMMNFSMYDPDILRWMGLPPDSGLHDIKKKFRELAKKYHPDTGGDSSKFIELIENYKKLVE